MSIFSLEGLWYIVIGLAIIFYTVLDGFDLGVGSIHLFAKGDKNRRIFLNAIGPVWDGNEVWLVIIIGALFAGFPPVYASLFSGFYGVCMLLITSLIFRAVAIEFRSKQPSPIWRGGWDIVFSLASLMIAFLIGVVFGNLVHGLPLDSQGHFKKELFSFFHPYAITVGIGAIALFMMHGAIFLLMKTEGTLQKELERWVKRLILLFVICYTIMTGATFIFEPHMIIRMFSTPYLFLFPIIAALVIANIPREIHKKRNGRAFISSCIAIALLVAVYGIGTFPVLVRSTLDIANSLTIENAASSPLTLKILLIVVCIGVPLVLAYGFFLYRTFRGKVKIGPTSY